MSMQSKWKAWPHLGNLRPTSPSSSPLRQTTHSGPSPLSPSPAPADLWMKRGMADMADGSRPLEWCWEAEEGRSRLREEAGKAWKRAAGPKTRETVVMGRLGRRWAWARNHLA
ncbi:hypothetical protein PanWU01x14_172870 [Parasponia andersonii]|uniref:Uncharacterized protein n=1 Tax=Parasponia andersonii TaxID=3476 RepID=A0A2P5C950_PARAD|nr:hypothetical protein PanWU01x14_172870 [Parasponia andersonii]